MGVDAHVSGGTGERLPLPIRNMLLGLGITILFGHPKVDYVDNIGRLGAWPANEKVVGLDISVDEVLLVYCLYPGELRLSSAKANKLRRAGPPAYHLLCHHDNSLRGEFPTTMIEEIFQARPKKIDDEDIV